jgi:hypothetical protein
MNPPAEQPDPATPAPGEPNPDEGAAFGWIVRPRTGTERRCAVLWWWVLALLFCGPQHIAALPWYPLGLATVVGLVVRLFSFLGDTWVGRCFDGVMVSDATPLLGGWGLYAILSTALLAYAEHGGRLWRVLAWTLVVLLVLNTAGCDLLWIDLAYSDD